MMFSWQSLTVLFIARNSFERNWSDRFSRCTSFIGSQYMTEMPLLKIGDLEARVPIIQGGMGVGVSLSGLASAVAKEGAIAVSYTHLRAHETRHDLVCRLLLEKKKQKKNYNKNTNEY